MRLYLTVLIWIAVSLAGFSAKAYTIGRIYVEYWTGTSWVTVSGFSDGKPAGSDISIVNPPSGLIRIFVYEPNNLIHNYDIGNVEISGTGTAVDVDILIGWDISGSYSQLQSSGPRPRPGCRDLKSLAPAANSQATVRISTEVHISGNLGDGIGTLPLVALDCYQIYRLFCQEIKLDVIHNTTLHPANPTCYMINMTRLAAGATILSRGGDLDFIDVTSGDIEGVIDVTGDIDAIRLGETNDPSNVTGQIICRKYATGGGGVIKSIELVDGRFGLPTDSAVLIAEERLERFEATAINADIYVGDGIGGVYDGEIRVIRTTGDQGDLPNLDGTIQSGSLPFGSGSYELEILGHLNGDILITGEVRAPIIIGGNAYGDITITERLTKLNDTNGRVQIDGNLFGTVSIGEKYNGNFFINDKQDGNGIMDALQGQIIINASNGTDNWNQAINLGVLVAQITLGPNEPTPDTAPYYDRLSSELGGGAIGLVPFMYHAVESVPDHDTVITTGGFSTDVTIEHYGPVADGDGNTVSTPPVTVYELALQVPPPNTVPDPKTTGVCDSRWTDVTSNYTYAINGRVITISGTFANWKAYQVVPADLVCNIDGLPAVTYAQGWQGTIGCTGMTQTYGYGFQVKTGFDLNMNTVVESGDIDAWLVSPVDFDGDTDADAIDLFMLVDAVANGGE